MPDGSKWNPQYEPTRRFAYYLHALKKKAYNKENYRTKCFLSTQEKAFWYYN